MQEDIGVALIAGQHQVEPCEERAQQDGQEQQDCQQAAIGKDQPDFLSGYR